MLPGYRQLQLRMITWKLEFSIKLYSPANSAIVRVLFTAIVDIQPIIIAINVELQLFAIDFVDAHADEVTFLSSVEVDLSLRLIFR